MATGIVSKAMRLDSSATLSGALLGAAIVAYVVLVAAYGWRLARYRKDFLADTRDPRRAFAFFTFVTGTNVLASRITADNHQIAAVALLTVGTVGWLLLSYALPLLLIAGNGARPALAGINGTWFIWVVGTQMIAVAATSLRSPVPEALAALAACCWAVGVVLYVVIAVLVAGALFAYPVRPAELTPPYWVFMGATAISVLAGAQLLSLSADPMITAMREVVAGLSVTLWAFGTWLIPFLVAAGVWRHLLRRVPLVYEPGLWSIVFPVGMHGVASRELGTALGVSWLVTLGRDEAWVALVCWAAVALAMAWALARRLPSRPVARLPGRG